MKKNLYNYSLTILGFIFIIYYIWFRFVRTRLPRDIPFDLTLFSTIGLLFICLIYLVIIYRQYKPKVSNPLILKISPYIQKLYTPIHKVDEFLRINKYVKLILNNFLEILLVVIYKILKKSKPLIIMTRIRKIYIILEFLPRAIIISLFLIDLYFNQLYYIYLFIIIAIIPLFIKYLLYLLSLFYKDKLKEFNEKYLVEITSRDADWILLRREYEDYEDYINHTPSNEYFYEEVTNLPFDYDGTFDPLTSEKQFNLTCEKFIFYQFCAIIFGHKLYEYKCYLKYKFIEHLYDEKLYKPKDSQWYVDEVLEQFPKIHTEFKYWIPILVYFYTFYDLINDEFTKKQIIQSNIIVFGIYCFIWFYILCVSLQTFHFLNFEEVFLQNFQDNIEPFSDITLKNKNENID